MPGGQIIVAAGRGQPAGAGLNFRNMSRKEATGRRAPTWVKQKILKRNENKKRKQS